RGTGDGEQLQRRQGYRRRAAGGGPARADVLSDGGAARGVPAQREGACRPTPGRVDGTRGPRHAERERGEEHVLGQPVTEPRPPRIVDELRQRALSRRLVAEPRQGPEDQQLLTEHLAEGV